jgi:RNA polymerase sigma-70 factor (ECF subfamily)
MKEAFETAFDEYADSLFRHAYFRVSNRMRAEELVQDTFMKTWDHIHKGGAVQNWKAFLFRVLNNAIIDEYRKKKSTSLDALLEQEDVHEGMFADLHTEGRDAQESALDSSFNTEALMSALGQLKESDRRLVVMRCIDERTPSEIAELLGESENVVSVRTHRALKRLKDIIQTQNPHLAPQQ